MTWKKVSLLILGLLVVLIAALSVAVSSYDVNNLKPRIAAALQKAIGREIRLGGDIDIGFGLSPSLVMRDMSLQNAPWGTEPAMAHVKRFELQVALLPLITGEVRVKRLILVEPAVLLERNARGRFNLELAAGKPPAARDEPGGERAGPAAFLPQLSFYEVRLADATLRYHDLATKQSFRATVDTLSVSADSLLSPVELQLHGTVNGQPISASGSLGSIQALLASGESWPLALTVGAAGLACGITGRINTPLAPRSMDMSFKVQGTSLDGVEKLLQTELPVKGPLEASLGVQSETMHRFKLAKLFMQAGQTVITGSGTLDAGRKTPRISAALHAPKLDLKAFPDKEARARGAREKPAQAEAEPLFPDTPIPTDMLRRLNADISLHVDSLLLPQFELSNLKLRIQIKQGTLSLDPLQAGVAQKQGSHLQKPIKGLLQ